MSTEVAIPLEAEDQCQCGEEERHTRIHDSSCGESDAGDDDCKLGEKFADHGDILLIGIRCTEGNLHSNDERLEPLASIAQWVRCNVTDRAVAPNPKRMARCCSARFGTDQRQVAHPCSEMSNSGAMASLWLQ